MKNGILMAVCAIMSVVLSCRQSSEPQFNYQYIIPEQAADGWETASLSSVGLNVDPILEMMDDLDAAVDHKIHSILIIKDSRLVFEAYFPGFLYDRSPPGSDGDYVQYNREVLHYLASVTKSVTSVLVGIAIARGDISGADVVLSTCLPQYANILVGEKADITLKHLLTMTSGLHWDESTYPYGHPQNDITILFNSADPIRYILEKPMLSSPGRAFVYKGGDTNVLGRVIRETSGVAVGSFARLNLFEPLGIEAYQWERFGSGDYFTSGGLYLRPRDLAKIGSLFLNNGRWKGHQVIPLSWVDASQAEHTAAGNTPWAHGYGYQWWIRNFHSGGKTFRCFFAAGWGDQHLFIFPQQNMIIQFNGGAYLSATSAFDSYRLVEDYILAALPQ